MVAVCGLLHADYGYVAPYVMVWRPGLEPLRVYTTVLRNLWFPAPPSVLVPRQKEQNVGSRVRHLEVWQTSANFGFLPNPVPLRKGTRGLAVLITQ